MSENKFKRPWRSNDLDPHTSNSIRVFTSIKSTTIFSKDFSDAIACISENGDADFFNRWTNGSQKRVAALTGILRSSSSWILNDLRRFKFFIYLDGFKRLWERERERQNIRSWSRERTQIRRLKVWSVWRCWPCQPKQNTWWKGLESRSEQLLHRCLRSHGQDHSSMLEWGRAMYVTVSRCSYPRRINKINTTTTTHLVSIAW